MKKTKILSVLLFLWIGLVPLSAQSVRITQELTLHPFATVLPMYKNEFGSFEKPKMTDTFPFAVIRMHLEGNGQAVKAAKELFTLDMGQMTGVESKCTTYSNQILFLVPARRPYIYIDCGDGCDQVLLSNMQQLKSNRVYDCTVQFTPEQEYAAPTTTQAPQRQFFKFRVTPANAVVTIVENGAQEILPMREGGIASKMLNYGTYNYSIAADKYHTKEGSFTVSATQTEMTVDLLPQFGWLTITGDNISQGGYVFATNTATGGMIQLGTIPLNNREMSSGVYTLRVQKEKYKDYSTTITIEEGKITTIRPSLEANFAQVTLTTNEGADIYVDGNRLGTTRWTGTLELGEHSVEARQASHHSAYTNVRITPQSAEQTITLNNPLPIYGSLIVDGSPADVAVYVDGKKVGTSPLFVSELLIGTHTIRLEKDGYDQQEKTVQIAENQESMLDFTLAKETPKALPQPVPDASSTGNQTFTVNGVSFTMVAVKGSTFTMGATVEQGSNFNDDEYPTHQVTLSDYYIGETEVTQELWKAVMGSNPSNFSGTNLPVEKVSWDDCQTFIRKLNQLTGQTFRLPTEAEWEFAARGGGDTIDYKYAGDSIPNNVAWYVDNSAETTHIVAMKNPNQLGLYDMSGNVCEWCQDWYGMYEMSHQKNPQGPASGSYRVYRGGSWFFDSRYARVSQRNYHTSTFSHYNIGLRLALTTIADEQVIQAEHQAKEPVAPAITDSTNIVEVAGISFVMIDVKGGSFVMGGTEEQGADAMGGERPTRQITISDFAMSQTEVTQALWQAVMGTNPSVDTTYSLNPVTNVTWEDCQLFIAKLNELTQQKFRLPTEAEWEYAARGGHKMTKTKYAGSDHVNDVAWHMENSERTVQPIGQKRPNELGLYDMSGNAREWCQDWFATYEGNNLTDPQGPKSGVYRVVRGGGAMQPSRTTRVSFRNGYAVNEAFADLGLRLVRVTNSLDNKTQPIDRQELPFTH